MCQMMESSVKNFVVIFAAMIFPHIAAFPSGLVTVACGTMMPNHGAGAQTNVPPYILSVSKHNYTAGESITVILSANAGAPALKGFFIQARAGSNTSPLGTFTTSGTEAQLLTCNKAADAVSHTSNSDKTRIEITWTAPSSNMSDIHIIATVVQTRTIFWLNVTSPVLPFNSGTHLIPALSQILLTISVLIFTLLKN